MNRFAAFLTRIIDWFYIKPVAARIPRQTFRYAVSGALNLVVGWVLVYLSNRYIVRGRFVDLGFMVMAPQTAVLCTVVPFTLALGFYLNRNVAFTRSPLRTRTQLMRYLLSWAGSVALNYVLLKFFVEVCGFWLTPSQMLATVIILGYSYLMQKYFTFRGCEE